MLTPNPNTSPHYLGERGAHYAQWQIGLANAMGAVNARKFMPFIGVADTVLDFGCGGGYVLLALQCAIRLGIEPNEAALKVALENGIDAYPSIAMLSPGTVDIVITNHALEHTTRPLDELRSIRAVLKPTGRLVMAIPIDDWRTQRHYDSRDINHHLYTWTPQLLGNLLVDAGFRLHHISVWTHAWPPGFRIWRQFPVPVFNAFCFAWAVIRRRRQIYAVAVLAS